MSTEMEWVAPSLYAVEPRCGQGIAPPKRTLIYKTGHNAAMKIEVFQLHLPGTTVWYGSANQQYSTDMCIGLSNAASPVVPVLDF